ncbi:hypothetical protein E2C01_066042 [Portunus trituberculatus]|uniref:Uncharacterized protein n=1 Tax=Portunus trituberculatus TaxID=210409 RepID=A0A5B7HP90_PORTR|nr:hypothetical protein [Portunus trituberculatus]
MEERLVNAKVAYVIAKRPRDAARLIANAKPPHLNSGAKQTRDAYLSLVNATIHVTSVPLLTRSAWKPVAIIRHDNITRCPAPDTPPTVSCPRLSYATR